jgi:hypothetical protein
MYKLQGQAEASPYDACGAETARAVGDPPGHPERDLLSKVRGFLSWGMNYSIAPSTSLSGTVAKVVA